MNPDNPHAAQPILHEGAVLGSTQTAFILLHGRGASASDILGLGQQLASEQIALLAPQASDHSWYPYSFLAPIDENQPWLKSALLKVATCIEQCVSAGIPTERIAIIGFSRGACLATAFLASNPARYGAVIAFTGGLPGPLGTSLGYNGDLKGTPVLLSSGDPDPHVPWQRVEETGKVLTGMGAIVKLMRHKDRPHTILNSELRAAKDILQSEPHIPG
jgi:phospholipase/carboxylesterase